MVPCTGFSLYGSENRKELAMEVALKPGWKTSEFWFTLIVQAVGTAYQIGIIDPAGDSNLEKGIALLIQVLSAYGYQRFRTAAKRDVVEANVALKEAAVNVPVMGEE